MRLFMSINFNDEIKDALCGVIEYLSGNASSGRYTRRENLHLTVAFIGESERADDALDVMRKVASDELKSPVRIGLARCGRFNRGRGDIWWVGIRENPGLSLFAESLNDSLRAAGFSIEKKRFIPHITIGREVMGYTANPPKTPSISMNANRVSLMDSKRVDGILRYTEIGAAHIMRG